MILQKELKKMSKSKILEVFKLFNKNWWVVDGLWFSVVEEEFGLETVQKVNLKVSERMAPVLAKNITEFLGLRKDKISDLTKALKFLPWLTIQKTQIKVLNKNEALFSVIECIPQKTRIKKGLKEFPCIDLGLTFFTRFAQTINQKVKVECVTCPPKPHPKNLWCQWRFKLEKC
ncbi:hypothetical protein DRO26_00580 [Candidatus Bathyarchaeota archaeon]|nr:MAG: hypothetical protein DRO26_00580 [Candidatus Bathyarchaeota archaeon]